MDALDILPCPRRMAGGVIKSSGPDRGAGQHCTPPELPVTGSHSSPPALLPFPPDGAGAAVSGRPIQTACVDMVMYMGVGGGLSVTSWGVGGEGEPAVALCVGPFRRLGNAGFVWVG